MHEKEKGAENQQAGNHPYEQKGIVPWHILAQSGTLAVRATEMGAARRSGVRREQFAIRPCINNNSRCEPEARGNPFLLPKRQKF